MYSFQEIPANNQSISQRKLIFGLATNDAPYKIMLDNNGDRHICQIYNLWKVMIQRCYDPSALRKRPDYKDCYVCDEWMLFSNFHRWVKSQDYKNKQIDKDILKTGNKTYC